MADVKVQQGAAGADRHHVAHDAVAAGVEGDPQLLDRLPDHLVIGEGDDVDVVTLDGGTVDLVVGVQDHHAVGRQAMQVAAVTLVVLVGGRPEQRFGVERQQQVHMFHVGMNWRVAGPDPIGNVAAHDV